MGKRWLIETTDGDTYEVTMLFNMQGNEVSDPLQASTCVIKFAEDEWASAVIGDRAVHVVN